MAKIGRPKKEVTRYVHKGFRITKAENTLVARANINVSAFCREAITKKAKKMLHLEE